REIVRLTPLYPSGHWIPDYSLFFYLLLAPFIRDSNGLLIILSSFSLLLSLSLSLSPLLSPFRSSLFSLLFPARLIQ
ncbi:MAG: hypothetical protein VYB60_09825, partial [SAR324 cluster bacterium]|nr:hypothetical protein [SAR324 cluster bacterium]